LKKTVFIKNALILTASSLILRFLGIIFKVWLAQEIGSEGMGLYQLTFSVYVLATTFALSGTSTAVTRLVTEELALGSKKGVLKILRKAILVTLFIAVLSVIVLYFGAEFIAEKLLCDVRTLPALKILPLSLPFLAVTSCLRGYFIARRKAAPNAISQIFEQAVRIVIILLLLIWR
jgi:stage V sporulation protein B